MFDGNQAQDKLLIPIVVGTRPEAIKLVPVILAPLIFEESWSETPGGGAALVVAILLILAGVVSLAGSRAVGAVIESAHSED